MPRSAKKSAPREEDWRPTWWPWLQLGAGIGIAILAVWAAVKGGFWPFRVAEPAQPSPSVWDYLFGDQATLGFVRLAVVALSLFVTASVAAQAVGGRWLKGIGPAAIDDPATTRAVESGKALVAEQESEIDTRTEAYVQGVKDRAKKSAEAEPPAQDG